MLNPSDYCNGGTGDELLSSSLRLSNGNTILIGYSNSGIGGNKNTPNYGNYDGWIVCLDVFFNKLWEVNIGGTFSDYLISGIELSDGSILVYGYSESGANGNKTSGNYGSSDVWVIKLSSQGVVLWDKNYGGTGFDGATFAAYQMQSGKILLPTSSSSGVSGNKSMASFGQDDFWLLTLDNDGNIMDEQVYGGSNYDAPMSILEIAPNKFSVLGFSSSGVSGNKTTVNYGLSDAWVILIDSNLNEIAQVSVGGTGSDYLNTQFLKDGVNLLLVGRSSSGVSGNKLSANYGEDDVWVVKLDDSLNIINDVCLGGTFTEGAADAKLLSNGNLLVLSTSNSNADGVKTENRIGLNDNWLVLLDSDLSILFQQTIGTVQNDAAASIMESNSDLILTSSSMSGANNDKTCAGFGNNDYWLYFSNSDLAVNQKVMEKNSVYPNPSTGKIYFSNAKYHNVTVFSSDGRLMFNKTITENEIDLSSLNNGVYFVQFENQLEKVIIQHE